MSYILDYLTSTPSALEQQVMKALFATIYLMWGVMWGVVSYHYLSASRSSWIQQSGRFRDVFKDFSDPITYAYSRCYESGRLGLKRLWCVLRKSEELYSDNEYTMPSRYSTGHYLRFSIFVGALSPCILGFLFFSLNRSFLNRGMAYANLLAVMISLIGAAGHIFIAYSNRPLAWTVFVVAATLWAMISPLAFYIIGWP